MRAFLARSGARRRRVPADPGAAGARRRRHRPRDEPRKRRDVRAQRLALGARVHGHLPRPPRGERADHRRRVLERAVGGARGVGRAPDRASASGSTSATPCGSTSSAGSSAPRVTSIRDVEWRDSRNGGFMFVFRPGALDQAPQTFVAPLKGPAGPAERAPLPARPGRAVPERVGDRLPRDPRDASRRDVEGDAGDHGRRRAGALQRRADPDRRRGDDEVPARLRGGGLQDARRQHADDCADAAVRVRRARIAGRR